MSIFNFCCNKESKGPVKLTDMDQLNGHFVHAMSTVSESVELKDNNNIQKSVKPNLRIKVPKPVKLVNYLTDEENFDTLHSRFEEESGYDTQCTQQVCQGSKMGIPGRGDAPRSTEEVFKHAQAFLVQYFSSIRRENSEAHMSRLEEVKRELKVKGTYQLKSSELVFGAKLAWRNASRCIGRIQWKKLQVFDCREVTTASGMFEAICTHIKYATNKGNIRSAITIFPQRTDGKHDYRIWNPQLLGYAGYVEPDGSILGDSARVEFTEICMKLGWKPPKTAWDILPLVLSADGKDPEYFDIPRDIVLEINLEHPKYDWFLELGLRWYAVPAVSSMRLDCGGLEFTGTAFNGWYMGTEIGCRNLGDVNRRDYIQKVAVKMGLDTNSYVSLWKDRALVELNIAVLHSFQKHTVAIVDHHSASEQFMKHLDTENKIRGGCPADWVWIVPPMSSSLTAVFHQEMALYYIRPSYEYQEPPWKTHQWSKSEGNKTVHRKFHFKQIARAVKFTSKLFGRALSKRIKATILYGSETGKSEQFANELGSIFGHAFNAQVHSMSEYDMFSIEHETLLLIVTSTFGNGEAPANGVTFAEHLFKMIYSEKNSQGEQTSEYCSGNFKTPTPKTLMRTNSAMASPSVEYKKQLSRLESNKSSIGGTSSIEQIGPLSNVCFAVFALGSSAYPKFCNFGITIDQLLGDLGGERILDLSCGDEMCGQDQQFQSWSSKIFHVACETFCLDETDMVKDAKRALETMPLTEETVRFGKVNTKPALKDILEAGYRKPLSKLTVKENTFLGEYTEDRATIFIDMMPDSELKYDPGDHIGIIACNYKDVVDAVLHKLKDVDDCDKPVQLQIMKETLTPTGAVKSWEKHERIPAVTIRDMFSRFLDINTPPSTTVLKYLANCCTDPKEAERIGELVSDSNKYDDWRHFHFPNLAEVLAQFPSCKPQGSVLAVLLPPLRPRFYSISSSHLAHQLNIHITVAIVVYKTESGSRHYGVCSNYLRNSKPGSEIFAFIRRAPSFHMPKDISSPMILVGPGSGIAPFRGFWHHRRQQIEKLPPGSEVGPIWLFFGCRCREMDLYKEEKEQFLSEGILSKTMVALSREEGVDKKYVQVLLENEGAEVTRMLLDEEGHFYVCGDCKMAEEVQQKLKSIIKRHAKMTDEEVDEFILNMMDENRYHEDIFGITLRTGEVHNASREVARRTRQESLKSQT